ncbi:hypothetical protein BH11PLA2_BH11PLA2_21520 [soil metagenome]
MIHVIATIEVQPGQRDAFVAEFKQLVPKVRAEKGCIEYAPTVDVASGMAVQPAVRPDVVVVVEKWTDLSALHAHTHAPHMIEFREKVKHLQTGLILHVTQPA